tara:strand:+ start:3421 stop:4305 length:885 start_codon:yes stop_codon:yes gene_type:complete
MAARQKNLGVVFAIVAILGTTIIGGNTKTQTMPSQRIVSLVPALTEILFSIGAGHQVIAVSSFDDYPKEVLSLPRVGALLDPDTERILSLRPDLVVIYGSQDELKDQLHRAGIKTFNYFHTNLADIRRVFLQLGSLTGHKAEAIAQASALESKLTSIRARVSGLPRPRTLLLIGHEPRSLRNMDASGGLGFLHDLLDVAGGANIFADVKQEAVRVSTEMLLSRNPEVVIDLHYQTTGSTTKPITEQTIWKRLPSIPAVSTGRIYKLYEDYLVVPGPRMGEAAEILGRALHPKAF